MRRLLAAGLATVLLSGCVAVPPPGYAYAPGYGYVPSGTVEAPQGYDGTYYAQPVYAAPDYVAPAVLGLAAGVAIGAGCCWGGYHGGYHRGWGGYRGWRR